MINKFFQKQIYKPTRLNELPITPGIYSYYDLNDDILYIGKSLSLRKRVSSYFTRGTLDDKTRELVKKIHSIRITKVSSDFEALLLEAKLINYYRPKYNILWKDDRHYIYIEITKEDFPRVILSRKKGQNASVLFGPYPSTRIVREILKYARKIFPFCNQRRNIRHPCFYSHIGLCNPCPGMIVSENSPDRKMSKRRYNHNIWGLKKLLSGEMTLINRLLTKEMTLAAKQNKFEDAAIWRNKIQQFKNLLENYHPPENYMFNPYFYELTIHDELTDFEKELNKLGIIKETLKRIECYDISNISGHYAVGSMVVFTNGEPDKKEYRHFRIRGKSTPDDFCMMREMLIRRLHHDDWQKPDLIIIDGGIPQLNALKNITESNSPLPLIGLSKKNEEIVFFGREGYHRKSLPVDSPGQHLLLRIRDEAHRFAHDYHLKLRLKHLYL